MAKITATCYCYVSEIDGALVVEIDGIAPKALRVNMNDNLIFETGEVRSIE